jgi:hypothetical protein
MQTRMQRIPSVDMFGNPKKMGIVEPVNGQQQPATVTVPAPLPTTAFRFEIMDAEGNPVPGASVSLYLNDTHLLTLPVSDVGGNAAVSVADIQNAEYKLRQQRKAAPVQGGLQGMGQSGVPRILSAVIQAPGYEEQRIKLMDVRENTRLSDVQQRHLVTLEKTDQGIPILPILGILAAIGAIVWVSKG